MNLNKVHLIGRLTRDPELKTLDNGMDIATFSIATSRVWYDKQKEKQEETEFHNLVAFQSQAKTIHSYTAKGSLVYIEGHLKTRSWEDKDTGKKMYRTEIVVDSIQLSPKSMNPSSHDEGRDDGGFNSSSPAKKKETKVEGKGMDMDTIDYGDANVNIDDIPF